MTTMYDEMHPARKCSARIGPDTHDPTRYIILIVDEMTGRILTCAVEPTVDAAETWAQLCLKAIADLGPEPPDMFARSEAYE